MDRACAPSRQRPQRLAKLITQYQMFANAVHPKCLKVKGNIVVNKDARVERKPDDRAALSSSVVICPSLMPNSIATQG